MVVKFLKFKYGYGRQRDGSQEYQICKENQRKFLKFLGRCTLVFPAKLNGQKVKALGSKQNEVFMSVCPCILSIIRN